MQFDYPHQLILFGPPGTSKSHLAKHEKAKLLQVREEDIFPLAFHPEFSYGEFVSRLLPLTKNGTIEYSVHAGPFLRALARAYVQLPSGEEPDGRHVGNVVLLIDEINRGNCAEIFGDVFQLLDRGDDGWSSYEIGVSGLTIDALRAELRQTGLKDEQFPARVGELLAGKKLRLPPNLYLIGTMNTSDESIFYMDSAFKRRWNFEFRPAGFNEVPEHQRNAQVFGEPHVTWENFLSALNSFILEKCTAPKLDDKLVGPWFIKAKPMTQTAQVTVADSYATELNNLAELAKKVTVYHAGADYSDKFDQALLELADKMAPQVKSRVLEYAGYKNEGRRILKAIGFDGSSEYYLARKRGITPPEGTMVIEDFLDGIGKLSTLAPTYQIARADIVGKLFLYLWDNVFDRDKTPLATLLGVQRQDLRTFGQFADRVDDLVARLCPAPAVVTADAG
jgi:5-methylcytosine-specific restriction enzyme B